MADNQHTIKELQAKAAEEDRKARPWGIVMSVLSVAWATAVIANIASSIFFKKPLFKKGFGGWDEPISRTEGWLMGGAFASLFMASRPSAKAASFREAADMLHSKQPDLLLNPSKDDWQQKVTTAPSQDVAPTVIGR